MAKFTRASLKSWIKKNKDNLYIKKTSSFNGMIDCVDSVEDPKNIRVESERIDFTKKHDFWIVGLWLVPGSRNSFDLDNNEVRVYNCCGSCTLIAN